MMGSALSVPLSDRGHDVRLVGTHLDDAIVESVRARGHHPTLNHALPDSVRAYPVGELCAALDGADEVVLGVSSAGVVWAAEQLDGRLAKGQRVLMISKGLGEGELLPELLTDVFVARLTKSAGLGVSVVSVTGPCIAGELLRRVPTSVLFSSRDSASAQHWCDLARSNYYFPHVGRDAVTEQVCAALKNAYAMGMAFGAGLHEARGGQAGSIAMHNHEAAVFAQAVVEMQRIASLLGGDPTHVAGLCGVGDLNVTCNGGRTGRFGKLLGAGLTPEQAVERMAGATLECLEILALLRPVLPACERRGELTSSELPLLRHLMDVALDGAPVNVPFERFFL